MKTLDRMKRWFRDDDGAVTVDWVVLTAAIVGLGLAVLLAITNSSVSLADRISTQILSVLP